MYRGAMPKSWQDVVPSPITHGGSDLTQVIDDYARGTVVGLNHILRHYDKQQNPYKTQIKNVSAWRRDFIKESQAFSAQDPRP